MTRKVIRELRDKVGTDPILTNPWCKFCGTQVDFTDMDFEVGVILGQESVLHTHGIEDDVTVIPICNHCSRQIRQEMGMKQIIDWSEK